MAISKQKFYSFLEDRFKIKIDENNEEEIKIPNVQKLWGLFIRLNVDCDSSIGERTPKNLYQIYVENSQI